MGRENASFGSETEIFLSDADVPLAASSFVLAQAQAQPRTGGERVERAAAFKQMYRLMDDFHRMRCERDAAFRELTRAHHETLFRLAYAAELKEGDSGVRIVRIGALSAILGRALAQPQGWCEMLLLAAPMLDVGKIGVPGQLLRGVAAECDAAARCHTELGARILGGSDIPVLNMACEIALCHHERWDGRGFPGGLAGREIPLSARIVAVVDAFDDFSSGQGDPPPSGDDDILARLQAMAGSRFDPAVVDAFVDNAPRLASARDFVTGQQLGCDGGLWEGDWWTVF